MESSSETEFDYSPFLFCPDNPLTFYIPPHKLKAHLRRLIEKGGGNALNKEIPGCIRLLLPGEVARSEGMIASEFLLDSVGKKCLQDMNDYKVTNGKSFMGFQSTTPNSKELVKKSGYLLHDDEEILKFMLSENRYLQAGGNEIWKVAQNSLITEHSWQSMKDRFRRHVLPNLGCYSCIDVEAKADLENNVKLKLSSLKPKKRSDLYDLVGQKRRKVDKKDLNNCDNNFFSDEQDAKVVSPYFESTDNKSVTIEPARGDHSLDRQEPTSRSTNVSSIISSTTVSDGDNETTPDKSSSGKGVNGYFELTSNDYSTNGMENLTQQNIVENNLQRQNKNSTTGDNNVLETNDNRDFQDPIVSEDVPNMETSDSFASVTSTLDSQFISISSKEQNMQHFMDKLKNEPIPKQEYDILRNKVAQINSHVRANASRPFRTLLAQVVSKHSSETSGDASDNDEETFVTPLEETVESNISFIHRSQFLKNMRKIKVALDWLNVPPWVLYGALYFNNGNLDDAIHWLLNPGNSRSPTFNHKDDRLLLNSPSDEDIKMLEVKYGADIVDKRLNFFINLVT